MVIASEDVHLFAQKQAIEDKKKKIIANADRSLHCNFPKFFVEECYDMFSMFIMPKRRTFRHFLASSEDKFFLVKKEDISSKGGRMVTLYHEKAINALYELA